MHWHASNSSIDKISLPNHTTVHSMIHPQMQRSLLVYGASANYLKHQEQALHYSYNTQIFSAYIFHIPTKCTYAMRCMYYYQHCARCFGAYCAIFRVTVCSKLPLQYLMKDLTLFTIIKKTI